MALVMVRVAGRPARAQRQRRLRSLQGLYRGLLVDAEHDDVGRWIEIEPHDVPHLLGELRGRG